MGETIRDQWRGRNSTRAQRNIGGRSGVFSGLALGLSLCVGLGSIAERSPAEPPQARPRLEHFQAPGPRASEDLYGDPLPPDAIARIGTLRWRDYDDFGLWSYIVPSPSGECVAIGYLGGDLESTVRVYDLSDGKQWCEIPWETSVSGQDMCFTPDGSRLMILAARGVIKFHDPRTGKRLAESLPVLPDDGPSPDQDSAATSHTHHEFSRDGRWIVSRDHHGTWFLSEINADPATGLRQVMLERPTETTSYRFEGFCSDGQTLSHCNYENAHGPVVFRWDTRTGKRLPKTIIKETKEVILASTPDGKRVATGHDWSKVPWELQVWNGETSAEIVKLEHSSWLRHFATRFSADGKHLVSAISNGQQREVTATVWELERGKVLGRVKLPDWADQLFVLPGGKKLLAVSGRLMFGVWDIATGRRLSPASNHENAIRHLVFTANGNTLLTATTKGLDERVIAWDAMTGKKIQEMEGKHGTSSFRGTRPACESYLESAEFVVTPASAVVTAQNGTLIWSDLKTGRELQRVTPAPIAAQNVTEDWVREERVSLARDPRTGTPVVVHLFIYGPSRMLFSEEELKHFVTIYDARSGAVLSNRLHSHLDFDPNLSVSPDGQVLSSSTHEPESRRNVIVLESASRGGESFKLNQPDNQSPVWYQPRVFTRDSQVLVLLAETIDSPLKPEPSAVDKYFIQLWEVRSGKKRLEIGVPFAPSTFAISADGRFLASAANDRNKIGDRALCNTIHIWNLESGAEVATRRGGRTLVHSLAFRPDGKVLASGHSDGTALIWDISGLPGIQHAGIDRETVWKDLASTDARTAYRAVLSLSADPDGVEFLRDRIQPAPKVDAKEIKKWVKDLDDDDFQTREAATNALKAREDSASSELQKALAGNLSVEQRRRIVALLDRYGFIEFVPARLRSLRSVEVLERVGSTKAREMLEELSRGASGARLTREAALALGRLKELSR